MSSRARRVARWEGQWTTRSSRGQRITVLLIIMLHSPPMRIHTMHLLRTQTAAMVALSFLKMPKFKPLPKKI